MSIEAIVWAVQYAPPMAPQLLGPLVGLANHADRHGCGAYPSVPTLAAYTCKSERSVQRDLKELVKAGLIRSGDQSLAAHIPSDRRPHVYDLAIEVTVPGGRAGDDDAAAVSLRVLKSSRARGGRKLETGVTHTLRGDAHVTSRGDAHVATGVTPTSPKPSYEPSYQPSMAGGVFNPEDARALATQAPIDDDGFALTDAMRRWARRDGYDTLVNIDHETEQFISHFRAEGTRRRSWPDEWQKWIRRSAKWASERPAAAGGSRPPRDRHEAAQRATDAMFDRAMTRARARMQQENP